MTKKTQLLFISIFLCLSTYVFAQELREEVAIVRAEPILAYESVFQKMGNWLENMRERELAEEIRSRKAGVHGSGFAVPTSTGELLFITNYHVVAGSDKISMEWKPLFGDPILVEGCEVLYVDPHRDLALIGTPPGANIPCVGFEITSDKNTIKDGMEIWAAGYPGLISSASWQLSNGIVSNQRATVDELVAEGLPYLIQHTSVIDPGSSGGPLLIKTRDKYEVVGVNAMTALYRNNTFFAVPSDILIDFIGEYEQGAGSADRMSLESDLSTFIEILSDVERHAFDLGTYIADDLSCVKGWGIYLENRGDLPSSDRDNWDEAFLGGNTLNALKSAVSIDLMKVIEAEKLTWEILSYSSDESEVIILSDSGKEYSTKWKFAKGMWTLFDFPTNYTPDSEEAAKRKNDAEDGDKIAFRTALAFYGGLTSSLGMLDVEAPGMGGFCVGVESFDQWNEFMGSSFVIGWENFKMIGKDVFEETTYTVDKGCLEFGYNLNIFPTKLTRAHVVTPWLKVGAGLDTCLSDFTDLDSSGSFFYYYWTAGAGFQFEPADSDVGRFGLMVDYKSLSGLQMGDEDEIGCDRLGMTLSYITKL